MESNVKKQMVYGIYTNNSFSEQYAATKFEAKKYCEKEAIKRLRELDPKSVQTIPLWLGQDPEKDGYYMVYGLPGPDDSLINISKYRTISGWFGGQYPELNTIFCIRYKPIERVGMEYTPSVSPSNIVKCEIHPEKVRDLNDPHDALLFEIESKAKKLFFTEEKKVVEEN